MCEILLPAFSSRICMVLCLTFKSLVHVEFILVYGVTRQFGFFFALTLFNFPTLFIAQAVLSHCMFFPPSSNINCPYKFVPTSKTTALIHLMYFIIFVQEVLAATTFLQFSGFLSLTLQSPDFLAMPKHLFSPISFLPHELII